MSAPYRRMIPAILGLCLLSWADASHAACGQDPECDEVKDWARFTSITLEISEPGKPALASWKGRFDYVTNDIEVDVNMKPDNAPAMKGMIAMVGGRVMLTQGLQLERGYEIDALDGPVLSMSLVERLLTRAFPRGPDSIATSNKVDRTDKAGIKYATASAQGYVPAPWHLVGTVSKNAGGAVVYDLVLSVTPEARGRAAKEIRMVGELAMLKEPVLPATMSVADWTTYGLGPPRFTTVADVRAYIADEYGPGNPDTTKDFTGDWKGKCDDDFGLKIIHYGDEGKYAVLFCGPGGCDDPARERLTYITGDKAYEVVSADELLQGRVKKIRYIRCSKDPGEIRPIHP